MVKNMSEIQFDYFYGTESEQFSFIRVPRVFFTDKEHFGGLSSDAKLLYGLMLDRMSLSRKNNWFDDENRVFIIFKIEEIADRLNCGKEKACNLLKELDDEHGIGLIRKKRRGLGQPSIIYVKNFLLKDAENCSDEPEIVECVEKENAASREIRSEKSENPFSCSSDNRFHDVGKAERSYIDINNTEKSYIEDQSFYPPAENKIFPQEDSGSMDRIDRTAIERIVEDQIGYDCLMSQPDESVRNMITEIKDLIVDVMSGERNVFVGGQRISDEEAKSAFSKLTDEHVMYVLHNVTNYPERIRRIDRFLLTSLYNAAYTYTNSVFVGIEYNTGIRLIE